MKKINKFIYVNIFIFIMIFTLTSCDIEGLINEYLPGVELPFGKEETKEPSIDPTIEDFVEPSIDDKEDPTIDYCKHGMTNIQLDEFNHWQKCKDCGFDLEKQPHNFIIESSAIVEDLFITYYRCSECDYHKTEETHYPLTNSIKTEVDMTVYVKGPTDWNNVYCYYWQNDDQGAVGNGGTIPVEYQPTWPGESMTLVNSEDNVWAFVIPKNTNMIIFNNIGYPQTIDIPLQDSNYYVLGEMLYCDKYSVSECLTYDGVIKDNNINKYPNCPNNNDNELKPNFPSMNFTPKENEVSTSLPENYIWNDIFTVNLDGYSNWKITKQAEAKYLYDVNGELYLTEYRLQSNGQGKMEIDLTNYSGKVRLEFYVLTGRNDDLNRTISLIESNYLLHEFVCDVPSNDPSLKGEVLSTQVFKIVVDCGKVYSLFTSSGINFHGINVISIEDSDIQTPEPILPPVNDEDKIPYISTTYLPTDDELLDSIPQGTPWKDMFVLGDASTRTWKITVSNKVVYDIEGNSVISNCRLQSTGRNKMYIDLKKYTGKVKLEFYCLTAANADLTRTISISLNDQVLDEFICSLPSDDESLYIAEGRTTQVFSVILDCGYYYTLKTSSGINFHGINVISIE